MILQYDDIVLQVIARLKSIIPQSPTKVADVVIMQNLQAQITEFFKSTEQSKIMVTYSGTTSEGGRAMDDFTKTIAGNTVHVAHTIEVHICSKRYMYETLNDKANTMLRLMWTVMAGLNGLKFFGRDNTGAVKYGIVEYQATEGMVFLETLIDRNYEGNPVAVCRFQVMEVLPELETLNPEEIWGTYQEITFEEYSQANGSTPSISGSPNEEVVVPEPV